MLLIVCSDGEILVGDNCIFISSSAGDLNEKPDCQSLAHSFSSPQNVLSDVSALISIHGYLVNLKVFDVIFQLFFLISPF